MGSGARHEFCCDASYEGWGCTCLRYKQESEKHKSGFGAFSEKVKAKYEDSGKERQIPKINAIFSKGAVVFHEWYGTGLIIESSSYELIIRWHENERLSPKESLYKVNSNDFIVKELKILVAADANYFNEMYQVGSIVEHRNISENKGFGEVIWVSEDRENLIVRWFDGEETDVHFKTDTVITVKHTPDKIRFDESFQVGKTIRTSQGKRGKIGNISVDRKEIRVLWDHNQGLPNIFSYKENISSNDLQCQIIKTN